LRFSAAWKSSVKQPTEIPVAIQQRYPKILWPQVIGMRNRLVQHYDILDYDIVWSTITQDLPPLIAELEKIVSSSP